MKDVFLQLVNMSITAGWLILAVMIFRLIFRRAPRWVFCLLWGFVGLRLVFPFSFESIFSLIPSKSPVNEFKHAVDRIVLSGNGGMFDIPSNDLPVNLPPVTTAPDVGVTSPSVTFPAVKESISIAEIFAVVWICGAVLLLVYAAVSYLSLRHKVRTAVRLEKGVWQSEAVTSPFVLGFLKPRIYLPFVLDKSDIPYVLAHERAHIFRRDHLIKPLGFMILAVYWFNPLIWIAYVLLCRDVELACDERVIRSLDICERRYYSTALLNCSVSRVRIAACPIAFGEVAVKERIKGVMNYKKPAFWIIILTVIAVIVTAVCFLTDPKDKEKEDEGVKQNEKEKEEQKEIDEEESLGTVKLSNISYECDSDDMDIVLVGESLSKSRPQLRIDFINKSPLTAKLSAYKLCYMDGNEWKECRENVGTGIYTTYDLYGERSMRLVRNLDRFDMTKPGKYALWQEFYYVDHQSKEINKIYGRVFFEISEGITVSDSKNGKTDLDGYVNMLTDYINMPNAVNRGFSFIDGLYLAARYSYENDMPIVKNDADSFRISREDMMVMFNALTGIDANVESELDLCHQLLELFGDRYDDEKEEYIFSLERNGWGERGLIHTPGCMIDPEREFEISENGNAVNVIVWITHSDQPFTQTKRYFKAEFVFEKAVVYDRVVYTVKDVFYHESPADAFDEVSVTGLTQDPETGFFNEFKLKVGEREKVFKGKAWADKSHNTPFIASVSQHDYTGDGIDDISVIFRTVEYDPDYYDEGYGRYDIHVFDGKSLEEIPGLENVPQRVQDSLDLSFDGEVYTIGVNGKKYHVYKKWYNDTRAARFYDLPSFTEMYQVHSVHTCIQFSLRCMVNETFNRYDSLLVNMVYKDGKFVADGIEVSGFYYSTGKLCEVHDMYYHTLSFNGLMDDTLTIEDWLREIDDYGYDNNGCNSRFNRVAAAKYFGITGKQLRDHYYLSSEYYSSIPDPLPLFELDEEGCDEFFRDTDMSNLPIMKQRKNESEFKGALIQLLKDSDEPIKRKAYDKLSHNVAHWSIPQLVYLSEMTLEEIEVIYSDFARGKENLFEYDFDRLFSERGYFEHLIETAEYPVFVDEALRK